MRNEQVQTASYRHLGTTPNDIHERLYVFSISGEDSNAVPNRVDSRIFIIVLFLLIGDDIMRSNGSVPPQITFLHHEIIQPGEELFAAFQAVVDGCHVLVGGTEFRVGQSCNLVDVVADVPDLAADASEFLDRRRIPFHLFPFDAQVLVAEQVEERAGDRRVPRLGDERDHLLFLPANADVDAFASRLAVDVELFPRHCCLHLS